jgi:hypothetical protein
VQADHGYETSPPDDRGLPVTPNLECELALEHVERIGVFVVDVRRRHLLAGR